MKPGSNIDELYQLLNQQAQRHVKVSTAWATVKEVNWNEKTMTATGLTDNLDYFEVLLGIGSFFRKPVVGSKCLIGIIENQDAAAFLIEAEAIGEAVYQSGKSTCTIKEEGFIVKQDNESLKQVLNDFQDEVGKLCDELNKVIVAIGTGPNVPAIKGIKERITGEIKQRLNQILIA